VQITLNQDDREVPEGQTVAGLLAELNLESRQVAVEVNLQLVPRAAHADCKLQPGDRVEVVTLVGGG